MKAESQRIAIAEAVGWDVHLNGFRCTRRNLNEFSSLDSRRQFDPLEDLNAMHEAEKVLTGPQTVLFEKYLEPLLKRDLTTLSGDRYPKAATVCLWHATASQRAEAFLKSLSLWDDTK